MSLLFDQNISFRITQKIVQLDCDDPDIWKYARKNNYSIVTFDSDFYDISVINGHPPKIIWIRAGNLTTKEIVELLIHNKKIIDNFLLSDDFKNVSCLELDNYE